MSGQKALRASGFRALALALASFCPLDEGLQVSGLWSQGLSVWNPGYKALSLRALTVGSLGLMALAATIDGLRDIASFELHGASTAPTKLCRHSPDRASSI